MKKLLSALLLASTLACTVMGTSVLASEKGTAYGKVPATDTKITVDGKKDAIYDKGLTVKVTVPDTGNKSASGTTGTAKLVWNGTDTIYVYAEVLDKEMIKYTDTPDAWNTDSVEVFFDYSNKVARTRDQYRIDLKGVATYYDTKTLKNEECKPYGLEGWAASEIAGGYAVEFQVKAYKEAIKADMNVGFHVQINDMVAAGRNMFHSDACMNAPEKFGFITLSGDKVTVDAPKTTTTTDTAAKTADMGIIVSAVALAAASGALVVLKKRK